MSTKFVTADMKIQIAWDGKKRTIKDVIDFSGSYTGTVMAVKGWEPRWYKVTASLVFVKSAVDGAFFLQTHAPEIAPGLFP